MKTLIRNAMVVLPDAAERINVLIDGHRIASIGAPDSATADDVIDANGLHLLPGLIDDQVHVREPGLTHKEDLHCATQACAKGGVTSFLEMPNTKPTTTTLQALEDKLLIAAQKCYVNFGFYIGATPHDLDVLQTATRTPGTKIFIGSSTGDLLVDDDARLGTLIQMNPSIKTWADNAAAWCACAGACHTLQIHSLASDSRHRGCWSIPAVDSLPDSRKSCVSHSGRFCRSHVWTHGFAWRQRCSA